MTLAVKMKAYEVTWQLAVFLNYSLNYYYLIIYVYVSLWTNYL